MKIQKYKTRYKITLSNIEYDRLTTILFQFQDDLIAFERVGGAYRKESKFINKFNKCKTKDEVKK